jgi:hypothetical protein
MSKDVSRATRNPGTDFDPPHSRTGTKGVRRVLEAEAGEDPSEGGQQSCAAQPADRNLMDARKRSIEDAKKNKLPNPCRAGGTSRLKVPTVPSAYCAAALKAAN